MIVGPHESAAQRRGARLSAYAGEGEQKLRLGLATAWPPGRLGCGPGGR